MKIKFLNGSLLLLFWAQQLRWIFLSVTSLSQSYSDIYIYVYRNGDFTVRTTVHYVGLPKLENLLFKFHGRQDPLFLVACSRLCGMNRNCLPRLSPVPSTPDDHSMGLRVRFL